MAPYVCKIRSFKAVFAKKKALLTSTSLQWVCINDIFSCSTVVRGSTSSVRTKTDVTRVARKQRTGTAWSPDHAILLSA